VAADGGRLKREWATLRSRSGARTRDLLWWEEGRLLGFLGIYGSGRRHLELTGMVDPLARRRGIGSALLQASMPLCRAHDVDRVLLVVPRNEAGGREFARAHGMTYEHSEHALRLSQRPPAADANGLALRQATVEDIPVLSRLYDDGFHDGGHVDPSRLATDHAHTLMITHGGASVGTIVQARNHERGAIYAFVVASDWRGRGIGRRVLQDASRDLFDAGARYVDLEVEVDNERALGLYTSVGFEMVATDDYYELVLH
jgi:ribosomal protein S18 acetylase RimI-like enzyme